MAPLEPGQTEKLNLLAYISVGVQVRCKWMDMHTCAEADVCFCSFIFQPYSNHQHNLLLVLSGKVSPDNKRENNPAGVHTE